MQARKVAEGTRHLKPEYIEMFKPQSRRRRSFILTRSRDQGFKIYRIVDRHRLFNLERELKGHLVHHRRQSFTSTTKPENSYVHLVDIGVDSTNSDDFSLHRVSINLFATKAASDFIPFEPTTHARPDLELR